MKTVTYSCVLAEQPKFAVQVLIWAWSLIEYAKVSPSQMVVHALEGSCPHARRSLEQLGVAVLNITPFHRDHPYCNKLRQLESAILLEADHCVLSDTDVAFVETLGSRLSSDSVQAKIVDLPNPPLPTWERIFEASGLVAPSRTTTSFGGQPTPSVNFNGGLYLIPAAHFQTLAQAWPRWARWLIDRPELLSDQFRKHIDQISFGLACVDMALPIEPLELDANYPTHAAVQPKPNISPAVIHYHAHVTSGHLLKTVNLQNVDQQIEKVNRLIRKRRRQEFDNQVFWNFRYAEFPDLGSGVGSRDNNLRLKRDLLSQLNNDLHPTSVLDIGCGDLEVAREVAFSSYTGIDLSSQALLVAKSKQPDWTFLEGDPVAMELVPRELVVCLDVLIHQPSRAAYIALLGRLFSLSEKHLVVSGYNQPPWNRSEITFYYEPLSTSIRRIAPKAELEIIGGYRDTTVIKVVPGDSEPFRQSLFNTQFGQLWSKTDDLISEQFACYRGHTRNELAILLSLIKPGDCVIDIGAHIGSFSVPIAKAIGQDGRLLCVEPEPVNQVRFCQNLILNRCDRQTELFEGAIGPAPRYSYVADSQNTGAGFLRLAPAGNGLEAVSLDALCCGHEPALIKIDVEGMELDVLRTGDKTIAQHRPLLYLEVSAAQLERAGSSAGELEAWLKARSFRLFRNSGPRNSDNDFFSIVEIDTLSLKESLFDCLAVPRERLPELVAMGKLPHSFAIDQADRS